MSAPVIPCSFCATITTKPDPEIFLPSQTSALALHLRHHFRRHSLLAPAMGKDISRQLLIAL